MPLQWQPEPVPVLPPHQISAVLPHLLQDTGLEVTLKRLTSNCVKHLQTIFSGRGSRPIPCHPQLRDQMTLGSILWPPRPQLREDNFLLMKATVNFDTHVSSAQLIDFFNVGLKVGVVSTAKILCNIMHEVKNEGILSRYCSRST